MDKYVEPDRFIRKVCHDLRAPLRALKELPDWLEEDLKDSGGSLAPETLDLLSMMKRQAGRMDLIVEGLGQFARLERGRAKPETHVKWLIANAVARDDVTVIERAETLPIEPEHARLIVAYLLSNAFIHGLGRDVSLSLCDTPDGHSISVADSGPGVPQEQVSTVFEPLSTLKPRDAQEGAGMGLAIVARISEMYGGECTCRANHDGQGSIFEVVWPV